MAKSPFAIISGVLNTMRGQFTPKNVPEPAIVKQKRLLVVETEEDAVRKGVRIAAGTSSGRRNNSLLGSTIFGNQVFLSAAQRRQENQEIMDMFPDLERNARYLIASYFSPVDLNITKVPVSLVGSSLSPTKVSQIQTRLTDLFEEKLELSSELPDIAYDMGFITGGELIVTVPMQTIKQSFDSIVSTEDLKTKLDALPTGIISNKSETASGMSVESLGAYSPDFKTVYQEGVKNVPNNQRVKTFLEGALSTEVLTLSSNLDILRTRETILRGNEYIRNKDAAGDLRVRNVPEPTGVMKAPVDHEGNTVITGEPLTIRVSAESAFFIFPPGSPDKPIAAVLMLDESGSPMSLGSMNGFGQVNASITNNTTAGSLFQDVGRASTSTSNNDYASREGQRQLQDIYKSYMSSYITKKVEAAGYGSVTLGETDSVMRNLFYRYLERRNTRMLIIPKEFFTYFTFDVGQDGIGRTKIEGIKQYLVMKMTVLVSRVLAATRAAADTRSITLTVDTASVVPEEVLTQQVMDAYCEKNLLNLNSLNLNSIQSRIMLSALQINVKNTSGATDSAYELTNEPATQGKPVDFDPELSSYLDSQINSKVPVPASLTSSLDEPELATTITTANLFYSMLLSLDQRRISRAATRRVRQYARYSEAVREIVGAVIETDLDKDNPKPHGDSGSLDATNTSKSGVTIDEVIDHLQITLPKPIISKSNAQFSNITNMVDAVTKLVDVVYPDSLAGDTDKDTLATLKAAWIKSTVADLAGESGMTQLNMGDDDLTQSLTNAMDFRDQLSNLTKALVMQTSMNTATTSSDTDNTTSPDDNGYGGAGSGGYV